MSSSTECTIECRCECGAVEYKLRGKPILRAICHCHACQQYNNAAYSDGLLFAKSALEASQINDIEYQAYAKPAVVERGKCRHCGTPILEFPTNKFGPQFAIVPTDRVKPGTALPAPNLHMFYHRRLADVDDNIPKYSGYLPSQLALAKELVKAQFSK